jgi:hypothetical protein
LTNHEVVGIAPEQQPPRTADAAPRTSGRDGHAGDGGGNRSRDGLSERELTALMERMERRLLDQLARRGVNTWMFT